MPSMARKTNTAARAARIAIPALSARREKTRSPSRAFARAVSSATTVVATCYLIQGCHAPVRRTESSVRRTRCWAVRGRAPGPDGSAGRDRVDDALGLLGDRAGERRGTGLLRRGLLALVGHDVGEVALHEVGLGLVLVGLAGDEVAQQDDGVGAGLGAGAVDVDGHVDVGATLGGRGRLDDDGSALGGRGDVLLADLDRDDGEVTDLALVGVADRAVATRHCGDDARGALSGLATLDREGVLGLVGPRAAGLAEVVGEVLGRARVVGAVDRRDGRVGEVRVGVHLGDGRVVPRGDLAVEDLGDRVGVHVERVDALEVERDRDGRDVGRDLDRVLAVAALLGGGELALVVVEVGVGAGEADAALDEVGATVAGADGVVVDGHVAVVHALEAGGPGALRLLLRGGAGAVQVAGEARRLARAAVGAGVAG